jgi:Carboxypeptidase regulatory-like domain
MRWTLLASAVLGAICLVPGSDVAAAQGVGASADLIGTITDPAGNNAQNAKVTVTDAARAVQRVATSDEHGTYRVSGLAPGTYQVSVELTGFQTEVANNVAITVGQTLVLDFHLNLAGLATRVEVNTEPPTVETQRGSQADTLTQDYIAGLPIDRRDYLTFTLLAPGVSNSTRLASDQDFRVKQTPQSGLSFYGSNGRGNSVTVDGGEANDDAGGVRLTLGQDAVQEFQINRSNYSADLGGASGATINIVSKSGSNDLHGSLFGYFRNDGMDAADPFARTQALQAGAVFDPTLPDSVSGNVKNALTRYQFGSSAGFPIKKDKSFLFASFEGLRQDAQNAVPLLTNTASLRPSAAQDAIISGLAAQGATIVPCFPGQSLPAAICAGALQTGLTVSQLTGLTPGQNALNGFLVNQLEANGGLFNYSTREYLASGRFDHRFNETNQFTLSYRYGHDLEENPDVQSLTGFSAGSSIHDYDNNIMAAWYHQFSPVAQNELRVQFDYTSFNVVPNEPGEVGLQIPGFVNNFGSNIFLPNFTITRRFEFADNVTLTRGRHTMKFGGYELLRGNHTESHTFFPGRFVFGSLPGVLISPQLASTTINPLQAASFGLPQVYQQGFGNPVYPYYTRPFTAFYWQDSWRVTSNFTLNYGLRYELDTQYKPLHTYTKDVGPRVSFAWDPFGNHKTVIRAGYGIYYAQVYEQIPAVDLSLGVLNANKSSVGNSTNAGQVDNLVGICGIAGIVPGSGSSPCNREISIYIVPLTGVPGGSAALNSAAIFQTLFAQGLIGCTKPAPGNYACITPASVAPFGLNVTNTGPLAPLQVVFVDQRNFRNPYSQQAGLGIDREIVPGFSVSASYIYSHTIGLPIALDTNLLQAPMSTVPLANGKLVSYRNWNLSPGTDPLGGTEGLPCATNPFACFVNPLILQNNQYSSVGSAVYQAGILEVKKTLNHYFTVFGNYTFSKGFDTTTDFNTDYGPQDPTNLGAERGLSEFDQRHKVVVAGVLDSPWKHPALSGFQLAPILSYNSGHPFNLLAGGEVNGDNHTTNERPIGAGRNTGLGPDYVNLDMRLTWQHSLHEKTSLLLTAEAFNVANHTNFASVNNVVGPLFGLTPGFTSFQVHGTAALSPSTPLGFTSAFPKREVQLGVRLTF